MAHYDAQTWQAVLERFVDWCLALRIDEEKAFDLAVELFADEHFGVEGIRRESPGNCLDDLEATYLNMGETYATTLLAGWHRSEVTGSQLLGRAG